MRVSLCLSLGRSCSLAPVPWVRAGWPSSISNSSLPETHGRLAPVFGVRASGPPAPPCCRSVIYSLSVKAHICITGKFVKSQNFKFLCFKPCEAPNLWIRFSWQCTPLVLRRSLHWGVTGVEKSKTWISNVALCALFQKNSNFFSLLCLPLL